MTFRRVIWFLLATHSLLVSWIPSAFCVSRSEHDYDFHSQPITERFKELGALTNSTGSQFGFENPGLKRLRLEAELGKAQAQFLLGSCYLEGYGVRQDVTEALAWFKKAANQGIGEAACSIGLLYQNRGTNDDVEAAQWFEKAVRRSNDHGRFHLGMCYLLGRGVQQNNAEAMELIQEAAEKGLEEAIIKLSRCFLTGDGTQKDPAEGKRWLLKGAETGSVQAQYHLGVLHDFGLDGETNVVEALKWYRKAATNSFPKAQAELGRVLLNRGTANDFGEAVMWLRKAGEQGEISGLLYLGVAHQIGRGVPQSHLEAARFYRMAAERGDIRAQAELGGILLGQGATNDFSEGIMWLRKAADKGEAGALYNLGNAYHNGRGVPQIRSEAVKYFRMAAERGLVQAQEALAGCYLKGYGVESNIVEALRWYRKAATNSFPKAQAVLGGVLLERGTTNDFSEGIMWLCKAADKGEVIAAFTLGWAYKTGRGVPQSHLEAARFYRMAAERDHIKAQTELGVILLSQGATNDFSEGIMWLRKAADKGEAGALYNLAASYDSGRGVPQSDSEAMRYLGMAAERGFVQAQEVLAGLTMESDSGFSPTNITLPQGFALQVPQNCKFIYSHEACKRLEKIGNPVSTNIVGMLIPKNTGWWFVLEFLPIGYVNDADQAIDPDKALALFQSEIDKQGILIAWETKPSYDSHLKLLHYAIRMQAAGRKGINRCFGLLGRRGVLFVKAVYQPESNFDLAYAREIIAGIGFIPGEQHSDYKDGDRVSGAHLSKLLLDAKQGESGSQKDLED